MNESNFQRRESTLQNPQPDFEREVYRLPLGHRNKLSKAWDNCKTSSTLAGITGFDLFPGCAIQIIFTCGEPKREETTAPFLPVIKVPEVNPS
ncbi:MAG: hypothetical protein N5P05_004403 (plasmid) [Chroococcopsis gigantea SAG 12.99]|jgi:hypothetical protein|nr:hypothetical protein [Chroococcopsis gigantea SAG 12.99]